MPETAASHWCLRDGVGHVDAVPGFLFLLSSVDVPDPDGDVGILYLHVPPILSSKIMMSLHERHRLCLPKGVSVPFPLPFPPGRSLLRPVGPFLP